MIRANCKIEKYKRYLDYIFPLEFTKSFTFNTSQHESHDFFKHCIFVIMIRVNCKIEKDKRYPDYIFSLEFTKSFKFYISQHEIHDFFNIIFCWLVIFALMH